MRCTASFLGCVMVIAAIAVSDATSKESFAVIDSLVGTAQVQKAGQQTWREAARNASFVDPGSREERGRRPLAQSHSHRERVQEALVIGHHHQRSLRRYEFTPVDSEAKEHLQKKP